MVSIVEVVTLLALILFIIFMWRKSANAESSGLTASFGRSNPRLQMRCKPYLNGRLAGSPHKAIKKMEDGQLKIKYKTSPFGGDWYPLLIPAQFKKTYEYPETEHKEGLIVVEEFQPDVKASDPIWDFYKDLVYITLNRIAVAESQLAAIKEQVQSGAAKSYVLASINSLIPTIEKLHQATEKKGQELSAMIIESPATQKQIEKPQPPPERR